MDLRDTSAAQRLSHKRTYSEIEETPIDPSLPLATKIYLFAERHISLLPCLYIDLHFSQTSFSTPTLPKKLSINERAICILRFSELSDCTTQTEQDDLLGILDLDQRTFDTIHAIISALDAAEQLQQTKELCVYMDANPKAKSTFAAVFKDRRAPITLILRYQEQEEDALLSIKATRPLSILETLKLAYESSFFNMLFTIYEQSNNTITVKDLKVRELKDMLAFIDDPEHLSLNNELDLEHPIFRYGCENLTERVLIKFSNALLPVKEANVSDFESYLSLQDCGKKGIEILFDYFQQSIALATHGAQFDALLTIAIKSKLLSRLPEGTQLIIKLPPQADDTWIRSFLKHPELTSLDLSNSLEISPAGLKLLSSAPYLTYLNLNDSQLTIEILQKMSSLVKLVHLEACDCETLNTAPIEAILAAVAPMEQLEHLALIHSASWQTALPSATMDMQVLQALQRSKLKYTSFGNFESTPTAAQIQLFAHLTQLRNLTLCSKDSMEHTDLSTLTHLESLTLQMMGSIDIENPNSGIPTLPTSIKTLSISDRYLSPTQLADACRNLVHLESVNVFLHAVNLNQMLVVKELPIKELSLFLKAGSCNPDDLGNLTPFFTNLEKLSVNIDRNLTHTGLALLTNASSLTLPSAVGLEESEAYSMLGDMTQLKTLHFHEADKRASDPKFCKALQKLSTLESLALHAESSYNPNVSRLELLLNNKPNLESLSLRAPASQIIAMVTSISCLSSLKELEIMLLFEDNERYNEITKANLERLFQNLARLPKLINLAIPYLGASNIKLMPILPNLRHLECDKLNLPGLVIDPIEAEGYAKLAQFPKLESLELSYDGWDEDNVPDDFFNEGGQFHLCLKQLMQAASLQTVSIELENYIFNQEPDNIGHNPYADLREAFDLDITISNSQFGQDNGGNVSDESGNDVSSDDDDDEDNDNATNGQ